MEYKLIYIVLFKFLVYIKIKYILPLYKKIGYIIINRWRKRMNKKEAILKVYNCIKKETAKKAMSIEIKKQKTQLIDSKVEWKIILEKDYYNFSYLWMIVMGWILIIKINKIHSE